MSTAPPPQDPYGGPMPGAPHEEPSGPSVRPQPVDLAVKLMYAGAVLSIIGAVASLFQDRDEMRAGIEEGLLESGQAVDADRVDTIMTFSVVGGVVIGLVLAAIWVLMGVANGKGWSWARIVATILGVLNVLGLIASFALTSSVTGGAPPSVLGRIVSILSAIIAVVVMFALWRPESTEWFSGDRRSAGPHRNV